MPESWFESNFFRVVILILIVAAFIGSLLVYFYPIEGPPSKAAGSTYGRITVDSPEVYTRERMVNDRFSQEAWLMESLANIEGPGIQGFHKEEAKTVRSLTAVVAKADLSNSSIEKTSTTQSSPDNEVGADQNGSSDEEAETSKLTQIDIFRAKQSYREEVRNSIIENQLDDRHDLRGNTLYRLKFDVSVIPGDDTSTWANVSVKFNRKKTEKDEAELRELFEQWMSDLRSQVDATYRENLSVRPDVEQQKRIYSAGLDQLDELVSLEEKDGSLFGDAVCKGLLVIPAKEQEEAEWNEQYTVDRYKCLLTALEKSKYCEVGKCESELLHWEVLDKVVDAFGTTLGQKAEVKKKLLELDSGRSRVRNTDPRFRPVFGVSYRKPQLETNLATEQRFVRFSPDRYGDSILVTEHIEKALVVPVKIEDVERQAFKSEEEPHRVFLLPLELNEIERETYRKYHGDSSIQDSTILTNWEEAAECAMVQVGVNSRQVKVCEAELDILRAVSGEDDYNTNEAQDIDFNVTTNSDDDGQPMVTLNSLPDELILRNWSNDLNCNERLKHILVAGREFKVCASDVPGVRELSNLNSNVHNGSKVVEIPYATIETSSDGQPALIATVGYEMFKRKLAQSTDNKLLFTYAVTPRESSQYILSSSEISDFNQLNMSVAGILGGTQQGIESGRSSLFYEMAKIINKRPIVVAISENETAAKEQSANFGWLIGPKLIVDESGKLSYRHLPSQNSLAVLLSAPSWWRSADVEIETGWLNKNGDMIERTDKIEYPISLPGDNDEITAALLLGGKRPAPSVEKVEPTTIQVGQKARLLIEGQNLWRSTVVTIGAQASKKIFVLPNMNGIIAEFDIIDPLATKISESTKPTLRVWTSEGMTPFTGLEVQPMRDVANSDRNMNR